ncbi:MAG: hypothetical protein HY321_21395 [Armatimonadetes bacterium]|nr:hypothetical protein [Armatimonadota bacterium]
MRRLAVVWLILAALPPAGAAEPLDNGGFDQGALAAGWQMVPRDVFSMDRAASAGGERPLRFSNTSPLQEGPWPISRSIVAPPGAMLRVEGRLRSAGFRGTVDALLFAPGAFTGDLQLAGRSVLLATTAPQSRDWQSFSFVAAPGRGGGMATLTLTFRGTGQVWVDGVAVIPLRREPDEEAPVRPPIFILPAPPGPGGENLLRDSGFEGGGIGTPWREFWNPKRAFGVICRFDRDEACEGRASARVTYQKPFAGDPAGWRQEVTRIAPGNPLLLMGHIRTSDVRGNAYLRLECRGRRPSTDGEGEAREEVLATATSETWWLSGDTPWTPVYVRLRAPEGTTKVVVSCTLSGRGTAWFDAVRLLGSRR